jgi:hypothetical protein
MDPQLRLPAGLKSAAYYYTAKREAMQQVLARDLEYSNQLKTAGGGRNESVAELIPFAIHLHTHDHGKAVWVDQRRHDDVIGELGRMDHYTGYGRDQNHMHINTDVVHTDEANDRDGTWQARDWDISRDSLPRFSSTTLAGGIESNHNQPTVMMTSSDTISIGCVMNTMDNTDWSVAPRAPEQDMRLGVDLGQEMCGILLMYYPHNNSQLFDTSMIGNDELEMFSRRRCFDYNQTSHACSSAAGSEDEWDYFDGLSVGPESLTDTWDFWESPVVKSPGVAIMDDCSNVSGGSNSTAEIVIITLLCVCSLVLVLACGRSWFRQRKSTSQYVRVNTMTDDDREEENE